MLLDSDTLIITRAELRLQQCFLRNNYQFKFMGRWFTNPWVWWKQYHERKAVDKCVRIVTDLILYKKMHDSTNITSRVYNLLANPAK